MISSIHSLRLEQMSKLILNKFKGPIILARRLVTGLNFTFVAKFYLQVDKPIKSFFKLPTLLTERYHSDSNHSFSIEIFKLEFCKHMQITGISA